MRRATTWLPIAAHARSLFVQCKPTPNDDCMMFFARGHTFLHDGMTRTFCYDTKHTSSLAELLLDHVPGIEEVTIGSDFVTVTRDTGPDPEDEAGHGGGSGETEPSPQPSGSAAEPWKSEGDDGAVSYAQGGSVNIKTHVAPASVFEPPHWHDLQFTVAAVISDHAASGRPTIDLDAPHPHPDTLPAEGDGEVVLAIKELVATMLRPEIQKDGGDIRFARFDPGTGAMEVELLGACRTCGSAESTLRDLIERTTRHWIEEVTHVVEVRRPRPPRASSGQARAQQGGMDISSLLLSPEQQERLRAAQAERSSTATAPE